jgi:hypothetical protein
MKVMVRKIDIYHIYSERPVRKVFQKLLFIFLPAAFLLTGIGEVKAIVPDCYITTENGDGYFPIASSGKTAAIHANSDDYPGVIRALNDLQSDINRVTGNTPVLVMDSVPATGNIILAGTLGKNPLIDKLVADNKIDVSGIRKKWESFIIQTVYQPMNGVDMALVITGSDKRGTIFGIYDLSARMGVSPWYWWADVPVQHQDNLFVKPGCHMEGEPAVKYRGIFINDEAPALSGWVYENYGGFNHHFYTRVFELILRLKANYLWPAMWGRAFYDDDPLNPMLADEYGVVIGTSHHEPMMRAHDEWRRYGSGKWNYEVNEDTLKKFWREGIQRMDSYESIVTLAMRGDGDEPMSEESNIALLEKIVSDQRDIIQETTGKNPEEIPQVWALYKEVQDYYDKGMRVPDDVTLLLCDDNWGNIRKLPPRDEAKRKGGYGIYYHFDYVGGPRNYKWLNTNPIPRIWEQMHLAYEYGADRIWIVNVGDIKPMEFPITFFLDYARDPLAWNADNLDEYTLMWVKQNFREEFAPEIAEILSKYAKYNSRRKPELLSPETYSLINYQEAQTVVKDYNHLAFEAEQIYHDIADEYKDAFYQLILFPVKACANLNELFYTVGLNHMYASQGRAKTNELAERARELFARDAELSHYYNKVLANGKWNHMMDQTHISYTYWQQPPKDTMPDVREITVPDTAEMAIAIEGSESWWPDDVNEAILPPFDVYNDQTHYIDVYNKGQVPFKYMVKSKASWLKISPFKGNIDKEERLWIHIDWPDVPEGIHKIPVKIHGPDNSSVTVYAIVQNPSKPAREDVNGFIETGGYVSMEAVHFSNAVTVPPVRWQIIPDLGRTLSAITPFPVTASSQSPEADGSRLEYNIYFFDTGMSEVTVYLSPTQDFTGGSGLRYAISFDDEEPQVVNMHADKSLQAWESTVANNINYETTRHKIEKPGMHVLKYRMVDPGIVLQKIVVDLGGVRNSYLGPPESYHQIRVKNK